MLSLVMEGLKTDIVTRLDVFTGKLPMQPELRRISAILTRLASHIICSAKNKLTDMVSNLKDLVMTRQRDISRIVTPHIQTTMLGEYEQCAADSGKGVFVRMKGYMAQGIDNKRGLMFDEANQMLMKQLVKLRGVTDSLITDLRRGFEPLWKATSKSLAARQAFAKDLDEFKNKMRVIYREAGIQNTEEGPLTLAPTQRHPAGAAQGSESVTAVAMVQGYSTVARQPERQSYTNTIHKKKDTSCDTANSETFGQQTMNDIYQHPLEDSPLEVVKSIPAAVSLLPKTKPDDIAPFSEPPAKDNPIYNEELQQTCPEWTERQGVRKGKRKDEEPVALRDEHAQTNCKCKNRTTRYWILRHTQRA
ncbi:hypothetical protein MAR_027235, partial [Mya arenaria]